MLNKNFQNSLKQNLTIRQFFNYFASKISNNAINLHFHYQNTVFKNKSSFYTMFLNFLPFLVLLMQLLMIVLLSRSIITPQNIIYSSIKLLGQFYVIQILIGLIIFTKIISITVSLILLNSDTFFQAFNIKIICQTSFVSKLVFAISSVLMSTNLNLNLGIFIGSTILMTLQTMLLTNTINRKDISYVTNLNFLCSFFGFQILLVFLNACYLNFQNQIIKIFIVIVTLFYFFWYIKKGHQSFVHLFSKNILFLCISLQISLVIIVFLSLFDKRQINISTIGVLFLISFALVVFFLQKVCHTQLNFQQKIHNATLRNYEFEIFQNNIQYTGSQSQNKLIEMGLLFIHEQKSCTNPYCFTKTKQLYNPQNNEVYTVQERSKSLQLRSRMLVKCLYELLLQENEKLDESTQTQILLNFYEFAYNELNNQWIIFEIYTKLQKAKLGFMGKIKIQTIFLLTSEKLKRFNHKLYQSKIQIETIFQSYTTFQQILDEIKQYLSGQIQVLQHLKQQKIIVYQLNNQISKIFSMIEIMDEKWKLLYEHLSMNKYWQFLYLIYTLFLKNEKLSRSVLDKFSEKQKPISISESQPFLVHQKQDPHKLVNQKILYHFQSLCILAHQQDDVLKIKNISKTVEILLGYSRDILSGSSIELLMSEQLQMVHHSRMKEWLQTGYMTNESSYKMRFTKIKNIDGLELDVVKCFKIYVNMDSEIDYVCLIKINSQTETQKFNTPISYQNPFDMISETINQDQMLYNNLKQDKYDQVKYSLKVNQNQKNMFLKNQRLMIKDQFKQLFQKKLLSRVFLFLVALYLIITSLATNTNLSSTIQYSSSYFDAMTAYRIPVLLNTNYYQTILNIGVQSTVKGKIQTLTNQFLALAGSKSIRTTIFDKSLSKSQIYFPFEGSKISESSNNVSNLSEIDLFYKISQDILTLKSLPINASGQAFANLNSYLLPSYSLMMNKTKLAFHQNFQNIFMELTKEQQFMIISFITAMVIYLVIMFYILNNFFKSGECVMKVFMQLKVQFLDQMETYFNKVLERYQCFVGDFDSREQNKARLSKLNKKEIYLNSKSKQIDWQRYKRKTRWRYWILIVCFIIFMCLVIILTKNSVVTDLNSLSTFQDDEFKLLINFPSGPIVGAGMFEKYFIKSKTNFTFNSQKYRDSIEAMKNFGSYDLLTQPKQLTSNFYIKWKNYFFGNPCRYNPNVLISLGINVTNCQTMLNYSFTNGNNYFFRNAQIIGKGYLLGEIQLTTAQITAVALGVNVSSSYMLDLLLTWATEYSDRVKRLMNKISMMLTISLILIVTFQLIVIEMIVLSWMRKENYFTKRLYCNFIPQALLMEQKIVAKQLEKYEIYQS